MKSFAPTIQIPFLLLACAAAPGLTAAGSHPFDAQLYQDVAQMQKELSAKGWQFQVGVNPAMQYDLSRLKGFKPGLKPAQYVNPKSQSIHVRGLAAYLAAVVTGATGAVLMSVPSRCR